MSANCVSDRATALVEAISKEREPVLMAALQKTRSDMAARGMSVSTTPVLEMYETCATELRQMAKEIWQCLQRSHESCGEKEPKNLDTIFHSLLLNEKKRLESLLERMAGPIVKLLKNPSLTNLTLIATTHSDLLAQYDTEIAIYKDHLKKKSGNNFERTKQSLLNNKLVTIIVLVMMAIGGLATFTDSLNKLFTFLGVALGNG